MTIEEAADLGAEMRFRAVMMTSIAFILGLVAAGRSRPAPPQISRRAVGTAVFGGMIAASSIGIFLVPMLYVTFQRMRESAKRRFGGSGEKPHPPAGPTTGNLRSQRFAAAKDAVTNQLSALAARPASLLSRQALTR